MIGYMIYKLKDGGYMVRIDNFENERMYNPPIFASSKIGECLEYIREQFEKAQ